MTKAVVDDGADDEDDDDEGGEVEEEPNSMLKVPRLSGAPDVNVNHLLNFNACNINANKS